MIMRIFWLSRRERERILCSRISITYFVFQDFGQRFNKGQIGFIQHEIDQTCKRSIFCKKIMFAFCTRKGLMGDYSCPNFWFSRLNRKKAFCPLIYFWLFRSQVCEWVQWVVAMGGICYPPTAPSQPTTERPIPEYQMWKYKSGEI